MNNKVFEIMAKYGLQLHVRHYPKAMQFVFYQGDVFGPALHCGDPMELIDAEPEFADLFPIDEVKGSYDMLNCGSVYSLADRIALVPDEEHAQNHTVQKAAQELYEAKDLTTGISKGQESVDNFETIFEAMR